MTKSVLVLSCTGDWDGAFLSAVPSGDIALAWIRSGGPLGDDLVDLLVSSSADLYNWQMRVAARRSHIRMMAERADTSSPAARAAFVSEYSPGLTARDLVELRLHPQVALETFTYARSA